MKKMFALLLIVLLLVGCRAEIIEDTNLGPTYVVTAQPTEIVFINDNPDLEFGNCVDVKFNTKQWGDEHVQQCTPLGYQIHEDVNVHPISVIYTGAAYSILPNGGYGQIGFVLPEINLAAGRYIIKVYGDIHLWDCGQNCIMRMEYTSDNEDGILQIGGAQLVANGSYRTMYVLLAPHDANYVLTVYWLIVHPTITADSYLTIERITIE